MKNAKTKPVPKKPLTRLEKYVPGRHKVEGVANAIKLSANEAALGASPSALRAYKRVAKSLAAYPDGACVALKKAIADYHDVPEEQIICGGGSDDILHLLAQSYLSEGDEAIYSQYGFLIYPIFIQAACATPVKVKEKGFRVDCEAVLAAINDKTRIIFLANPNNPTGTALSKEELVAFHAKIPPHILLVLDGAYAEYAPPEKYSDGAGLVSQYENVVILRTFSKAYGLAGLRVGWAYAPPEIANVLNRIRSPFNVSTPAQMAAIAALKDDAFLQKNIRHNEKYLRFLSEEITALGFEVTPSWANFLLIHFKDAAKADAYFSQKGLILRALTAYGLPKALRLSVGSSSANKKFVRVLKEFYEEGGR